MRMLSLDNRAPPARTGRWPPLLDTRCYTDISFGPGFPRLEPFQRHLAARAQSKSPHLRALSVAPESLYVLSKAAGVEQAGRVGNPGGWFGTRNYESSGS